MGEDRYADVRRTTVADAAQVLGISAEAVRGRIRRGTLPVEREGRTVYVLLDVEQDDRTTTDQPRTTTDRPDDRTELLIAELQDRVRSLEEANRENRRIIAALTQRIPEIEAPASGASTPQEPSESPSEATEGTMEPTPSEPSRGPQQGAQPRSSTPAPSGAERISRPWWRRVFGR